MADEIKVPDFNLGEDFSESEGNPKTENTKPNDQPQKQKPKLLFEDEEEQNFEEVNKNNADNVTQHKPDSSVKHEEEPVQKKKKHLLLWLIPILIIIISVGSFYLQTQGYFDFGVVFTELGKLKDKVFGSKDTLAVAVIDSSKIVAQNKVESPYENEFLRKPKTTEKKEPVVNEKKNETKTGSKIDNKVEPSRKEEPQKIAETKKESLGTKVQKEKKTENLKSTGKYSIQVSAWKLKSKANYEANRLKKKGLDVKVVSVFLSEKGGTWYRVMIGSYSTIDEAKKQIEIIKRVSNTDNCIIREN
jgi:cell division protein FtsN